MDLPVRAWGLLSLVLVQWTWSCFCLTVEFQNSRPLSVALGRTLVLEAQVKTESQETIRFVTWEKEVAGEKIRLFPTENKNPRVFTENQNRTLRVTDFTKDDYGKYTITVTDKEGFERSNFRIVKESDGPPKMSIALLCEASHDSEQWDIPMFIWLADGVRVMNTTAKLSADGRKLYPSGDCVHNYTCVVNSSLGTSSNHFYNIGCGVDTDNQSRGHECTIPSVLLGVLVVINVAIIIIYIIRRRPCQTRSNPVGFNRGLRNLPDTSE